ncbi:hypothetical protein Sta7437_4396 [Stanieria cyanosphaera PCC 7437]|uniref:Uncharacterized protein n=1 Tax=Stanieria cyanosphaera (strain ATCC 29371 / PCC 7437) TaxID=111780 RepID=K9XZ38_STAC7|nr:hypothetical protein [Stanieria cyanosphaera]AFZ37865.1 hypothetical protein Sta7437_4396 [Stanieria cyanosphaera PCC 7437]
MYRNFLETLKAKFTNLLTIALLLTGLVFGNLLYSVPATANSLTAEAESYAQERNTNGSSTETRSIPTQVKDAFGGAKDTFTEGTKNAQKEVENLDSESLSKQKMGLKGNTNNKIGDYQNNLAN